MSRPLVAVTADIREFDNYTWHCAPATYLEAALRTAAVTPLIVPAFGDDIDIQGIMSRVDGLLVTGSRTNVHPSNYGEEPTAGHEPFDQNRDSTSFALIRLALEEGIPLLAICRGMQELNVALGGALATEIQEQPGIDDHRAPESNINDERFAIRHSVRVKESSCLAQIVGNDDINVNSLHRQAVSRLSSSLAVEATAPDGTIEAVSVMGAKGFAIGVQWHPEYWAQVDVPSKEIFKAFGEATRVRQSQASVNTGQ